MFKAVRNIVAFFKSLVEMVTTLFDLVINMVHSLITAISVATQAINSTFRIFTTMPAVLSVSAAIAVAIVVANYLIGRDNT